MTCTGQRRPLSNGGWSAVVVKGRDYFALFRGSGVTYDLRMVTTRRRPLSNVVRVFAVVEYGRYKLVVRADGIDRTESDAPGHNPLRSVIISVWNMKDKCFVFSFIAVVVCHKIIFCLNVQVYFLTVRGGLLSQPFLITPFVKYRII